MLLRLYGSCGAKILTFFVKCAIMGVERVYSSEFEPLEPEL